MANTMMTTSSKQRGLSLVEVLVTVVILGGSLMALSALQNRSLQYNQGAYYRSQANIAAYDFLDRIRLATDGTGTPQPPAAAVVPSSEIADVLRNMPAGSELDASCSGRVCTITVTWPEQQDVQDGTASFVYTTRI